MVVGSPEAEAEVEEAVAGNQSHILFMNAYTILSVIYLSVLA